MNRWPAETIRAFLVDVPFVVQDAAWVQACDDWMFGFEECQKMRALGEAGHVPVVTALNDSVGTDVQLLEHMPCTALSVDLWGGWWSAWAGRWMAKALTLQDRVTRLELVRPPNGATSPELDRALELIRGALERMRVTDLTLDRQAVHSAWAADLSRVWRLDRLTLHDPPATGCAFTAPVVRLVRCSPEARAALEAAMPTSRFELHDDLRPMGKVQGSVP